MAVLLTALLIFCLRVLDVSIGTVRVIYAVRGRRAVAAGLGLLESGIFIFAISRVFTGQTSPWTMLAYAGGFAVGNYVGITLEGWIASGTVLVRVVSKADSPALRGALHDGGFGTTALQGTGHQGDVSLLFVVAPRRRQKELLRLIEHVAPDSFVTLDAVHQTLGGYLTAAPIPATVRK